APQRLVGLYPAEPRVAEPYVVVEDNPPVVVENDPPRVTHVARLRPPTRAEGPAPLDDDVVDATRRGERWAWEAAYDAYARPLTGFLVLRLRDQDEVAEALSETFLRA